MANSKHILFLVASLGIGGAQKIASFVMNACVKEGYNISVISLSKEEINVYLKKEINIYYLDDDIKNKYFSKINQILLINKTIKKLKPDLIIIFGSYTFPSIGVLLSNVPVIGCERGDPFTYSKLRQIINKILYKKYKFSIFQSDGARRYYNINKENSSIIVNPCFDINVFDIKKEKVISAAGRITKDKGFDTLIEAFDIIKEDIPDYKLVIYGEGIYKNSLEKKINDMNLNDRILLFGKVNNLPKYICNSELFVLSSWFEGLPNVLIEAMCLGLPIVSTDCSPGGARFLMDGGKRGGIIVPIKDSMQMAEAIKMTIINKSKSKILGEKGRELIELYSPDKIEKEWLRVINLIVESERNK